MTAGRINQVITALQPAPIVPSIKKDTVHFARGNWDGVGGWFFVYGARVVAVCIRWGKRMASNRLREGGVWMGGGRNSAATALVCPQSTKPREHLREPDAAPQFYQTHSPFTPANICPLHKIIHRSTHKRQQYTLPATSTVIITSP